MEKVSGKQLIVLVKEFAEVVSGQLIVSDGISDFTLSTNDTLSMWLQLPNSSYTPMFLGWILSKGYSINSVTLKQLDHAVQVAAVGENKNVMFDYLGEWDGKSKSH